MQAQGQPPQGQPPQEMPPQEGQPPQEGEGEGGFGEILQVTFENLLNIQSILGKGNANPAAMQGIDAAIKALEATVQEISGGGQQPPSPQQKGGGMNDAMAGGNGQQVV